MLLSIGQEVDSPKPRRIQRLLAASRTPYDSEGSLRNATLNRAVAGAAAGTRSDSFGTTAGRGIRSAVWHFEHSKYDLYNTPVSV